MIKIVFSPFKNLKNQDLCCLICNERLIVYGSAEQPKIGES